MSVALSTARRTKLHSLCGAHEEGRPHRQGVDQSSKPIESGSAAQKTTSWSMASSHVERSALAPAFHTPWSRSTPLGVGDASGPCELSTKPGSDRRPRVKPAESGLPGYAEATTERKPIRTLGDLFSSRIPRGPLFPVGTPSVYPTSVGAGGLRLTGCGWHLRAVSRRPAGAAESLGRATRAFSVSCIPVRVVPRRRVPEGPRLQRPPFPPSAVPTGVGAAPRSNLREWCRPFRNSSPSRKTHGAQRPRPRALDSPLPPGLPGCPLFPWHR